MNSKQPMLSQLYRCSDMSIYQEERHHGVVILRLLEEVTQRFPEARFNLQTCVSRSSYIFNVRLLSESASPVEFRIGLFIKTSNMRKSPWSFSFHESHQDEIRALKTVCGEVFVVFVNGDDGIAALDFSALKQILDHHHEEQEWVRISRKPRQAYRVAGNDGRLERALPRNSFPGAVSDYFQTLLSP